MSGAGAQYCARPGYLAAERMGYLAGADHLVTVTELAFAQ